MNIFDHINVILFTVLYPAYVFYTYPKIKADLIDNKPGRRVRDYKETIFWLWLLCIITIVVWLLNGRSFNVLNLDFSLSLVSSISLLLFIITPFLFFMLFRSIRNNGEQRRSIKEKFDDVAAGEFLPRTKHEFQWFVFLSITAGICEELLFRGFLIWYLEPLGGSLFAVVLSSVLFGLAHSYQGGKGIVRTGLMGLVLGLILLWTDSLLILIFLHIAGDVYNGIVGWLGYGEFEEATVDNSDKTGG